MFLFLGGLAAKIVALGAFLLASFTDLLDGYLAKRTNQVTNFGKLMDPIADKILVISAFLAFVELGLVPAWMVVLIIFRELAVTALRGMALAKGKVMPADSGGKHKTVWQIFVIFLILFFLILNEGLGRQLGFWSDRAADIYKDAVFVFMLITVVLTLASGLAYFVKNKEVYSNEKTY